MPTELEELVAFLHSPQPAVVQIALDNLVGYSQGAHQQIFAYDNYRAITDLKELTKSKGQTMVNQSVTILINLCDDVRMRNLIVEDTEYVKFLIGQIINLGNSNADLMTILLTNIAKSDKITRVFDFEYELSEEQRKVFKSNKAMDCLMDCFVKGSDRSLNRYADFDYLAYFFADISRFSKGRSYFITRQEYDGVVPIAKLLVFTEKYDAKIRREGVASTIKNSLFDSNVHMELMTNEDINLLPYILLPLAGPEELPEDDMFNLPPELQLLPEDKVRDPVDAILITHLESLLLLCTTREAREHLREMAVYALIRELHKVHDEKSDEIQDHCDRVVQLLMRDEANPGEDEVDMDQEDSDEEDDKIVEIL